MIDESRHARLEARGVALRAWAEKDPFALHREFIAFEREVRAHLAAEEDELLPALAADAPADAFRIREHDAELRRELERLGTAIELHAAHLASFDDVLCLLHRHTLLWRGDTGTLLA